MIRIKLKVQCHNKGTEEVPVYVYDINTFKHKYSDAVLECCLEDFLDFQEDTTTNKRKAKYCMCSCSTNEIADMLDDYARRNGVIRFSNTYPQKVWFVCYEYCKKKKGAQEAEKTLFTICINCTNKGKYIHDIYITKTYEEMAKQFRTSLESRAYENEYTPELLKYGPIQHLFCLNASEELWNALEHHRIHTMPHEIL